MNVDKILKKAKLKVIVKRRLRRYGYPPDLEKMAVDRILEQSKVIADDWVGRSQYLK